MTKNITELGNISTNELLYGYEFEPPKNNQYQNTKTGVFIRKIIRELEKRDLLFEILKESDVSNYEWILMNEKYSLLMEE